MPDSINPNFKPRKRKELDLQQYVEGIGCGDALVLADWITLCESNDLTKKEKGLSIIRMIADTKGEIPLSNRIAITGPPGVGKSTFINTLALKFAENNKKVAVLAIDPSSKPTKGAILGDKTRMDKLTSHSNIFIRPTAAGSQLGGVANGTYEAMIACELAGYDTILVETVGVGQSEHHVGDMVDVTLLLIQPGSGDDLQGIKRGIIEIADIFVVNKDDGDMRDIVRHTLQYYRNALSVMTKKPMARYERLLSVSSLLESGFDQVIQSINILCKNSVIDGHRSINRKLQHKQWLQNHIEHWAMHTVMHHPDVTELISNADNHDFRNTMDAAQTIKKVLNEKLF